jgi:hypothetical protein
LPEPVKGAVTVLGGVAGVAALGAGAFLSLTPKILDTVNAFNTLAPSGSKTRGALSAAAGAAGKAATAYAALATAAALAAAATEGNRRKTSVEDFNNALLGTAQNSASAEKALDAAFNGVLKTDLMTGGTTNVNSFADALDRIYHASPQDSLTDFRDTFFGQNASSGINAAKDAIGNYDKALAAMATSGNFKDSAAGFQLAAKKAKENGDSLEDLVELFPAYKDAILENKTANGETQVSQDALIEAMLKGGKAAEEAGGAVKTAGESAAGAAPLTEEMVEALEEVGLAADGTVTDLAKFTDALINAGLLQLSARDAARGFEEAIDAMSESLKANGRTLDTTTEAGRANEAALDGIAGAGYRSAQAMAANGSSQEALAGNLDTTFNKLVAAAREFTNTDAEAQALARDIMKIPPGVDIKTWMADEAKRMAEATKGAVDSIPVQKNISVNISVLGLAQAQEAERLLNRNSQNMANQYASGNAYQTPGGWAGGRVGDIMGLAGGGIVPGTPPANPRVDNILALVNGKPLAVRSGEWIINEPMSREYPRELAAINAGTFPKLPGYAEGGMVGREWSAQQLGYAPAAMGASQWVAGDTNVTVLIGGEAVDARFVRVVRSELDQVSAIARGRSR